MVFNQQAQANLQTLANYYDTRLRTGRLLNDARNMREQVRTGGDAAATSNGLALMLLKSQAFALSAGLPAQLQVQVSLPVTEGAAAQTADLDALIAALGKRDAELATAIADLSRQLLSGEGYAFPPPTGTVSPLPPLVTCSPWPLPGIILNSSLWAIWPNSPRPYPPTTPLAASATDKSKSLLQLSGLETLPDYSTAEPVTQSIDKLQQEISAMQAQLEQQQSTKQQLTQARDLTPEHLHHPCQQAGRGGHRHRASWAAWCALPRLPCHR